jgi:hypothetical protein
MRISDGLIRISDGLIYCYLKQTGHQTRQPCPKPAERDQYRSYPSGAKQSWTPSLQQQDSGHGVKNPAADAIDDFRETGDMLHPDGCVGPLGALKKKEISPYTCRSRAVSYELQCGIHVVFASSPCPFSALAGIWAVRRG